MADLDAHPGTSRRYSIAVHRPKPGFVGELTVSMHRFGAAARTQPGLREVYTLHAEGRGVMVRLAVWDSAEAKAAANPALGAAVAGDDFAAWEEGPIEGWTLTPV